MQSTTAKTSPLNIIDRLAAFIAQYVFLPHKSLYRLLALWVVATYLHQEFGYMGYVFAYSARPQSGKSRLLEVLNLLVYQPSGIIVSPTEAVIFRTASGQTQLIDEADSCGHLDSLRSVLNAGFQRGGNVKRMERRENGSYQPVPFPVYGPRILAGIGRGILDATTLDRTFGIQMVRQKKSERGQRFRLKSATVEAEALRKEIEQWVSENKASVQAKYDSEFAYLEDFRDRTIDVAEPLAAILEVALAKENKETLEKARRDLLEAIGLTRKEESVAFDSSVLVALAKLAQEGDPLVASASELAEMLTDKIEGANEYNVATVLRNHEFETKSVRKDGADPRYRYTLPHKALADLVERYGGTGGTEPQEATSDEAVACVPTEG